MRKILLVLLCFPLLSFGGITYHNINDGVHQVGQGVIFDATESATTNDVGVPILVCTATDSGKISPIKIKWIITVNNYNWHYTMDTIQFLSSKILPPPGVVYKIDVKGVIDSSSYKGFYGFIACQTMYV